MNITLVDFTQENGVMEIWSGGTHLMPNGIDLSQLLKKFRVDSNASRIFIDS
tara:strand:- start:114 stop:269 length:156 start_codon:yes stop_codon:yes gene_type:complete